MGTVLTDEDNLFTQTTYGAIGFRHRAAFGVFFKKRRFTQFSRVGLTYQFSATTYYRPAG